MQETKDPIMGRDRAIVASPTIALASPQTFPFFVAPMHLILPCAATAQWPASALTALQLPHLHQLLTGMQPSARLHEADDAHPLMPHEQVEAQARGWPSKGPWPWAALASGQTGAQAWLT